MSYGETTKKFLLFLEENGPQTFKQLQSQPFWGGIHNAIPHLIKQGRIEKVKVNNPDTSPRSRAVVAAIKLGDGAIESPITFPKPSRITKGIRNELHALCPAHAEEVNSLIDHLAQSAALSKHRLFQDYLRGYGAAKNRKIDWQLTFSQWLSVWITSPGWNNSTNNRRKRYALTRKDSRKPWSLQNVEISLLGTPMKKMVKESRARLTIENVSEFHPATGKKIYTGAAPPKFRRKGAGLAWKYFEMRFPQGVPSAMFFFSKPPLGMGWCMEWVNQGQTIATIAEIDKWHRDEMPMNPITNLPINNVT